MSNSFSSFNSYPLTSQIHHCASSQLQFKLCSFEYTTYVSQLLHFSKDWQGNFDCPDSWIMTDLSLISPIYSKWHHCDWIQFWVDLERQQKLSYLLMCLWLQPLHVAPAGLHSDHLNQLYMMLFYVNYFTYISLAWSPPCSSTSQASRLPNH